MVPRGIAIEMVPSRPIFEKCAHLREKRGVPMLLKTTPHLRAKAQYSLAIELHRDLCLLGSRHEQHSGHGRARSTHIFRYRYRANNVYTAVLSKCTHCCTGIEQICIHACGVTMLHHCAAPRARAAHACGILPYRLLRRNSAWHTRVALMHTSTRMPF